MRRSSRIRRIGAAILSSLVLVFLVSRGLAQHPADAAHPAEPAAQHAETAAPEHAEAHEAGPHDVHSMTPKDEMMAILEHKVENTTYIHEWPFPEIHLPQDWKVNVAGMTINLSPSRHLVYMWFSFLLTIVLTLLAARQNARSSVPKGFGNLMESVIVFIRDEVAAPFLGKDTARYLPILLTFFFFISIMNLVGLMPFGATATGNINVTAGLAIITFSLMLGGGMRANGVFGYMKGLVPHGLPAPLYIVMVPIEITGMFTKPFALTMRLFANMLSGSLVIGAFYGLIFGLDSVAVAPLSLLFLLFMSLLKIFVCLLQAYIFTMLSAFFIGMSVHQEH
ncbi:MAG: F0F1 ATP synthase subunit A [Ignavibacteria bacterium]|nr:F0F1 ATP synthase subunit A [Ignavibacteria bacterium]